MASNYTVSCYRVDYFSGFDKFSGCLIKSRWQKLGRKVLTTNLNVWEFKKFILDNNDYETLHRPVYHKDTFTSAYLLYIGLSKSRKSFKPM